MTYEDLKIYIRETYDCYDVVIAWAYNIGYLDSLTDNTENFKHQEITALITLNSEIRKEKGNVL